MEICIFFTYKCCMTLLDAHSYIRGKVYQSESVKVGIMYRN